MFAGNSDSITAGSHPSPSSPLFLPHHHTLPIFLPGFSCLILCCYCGIPVVFTSFQHRDLLTTAEIDQLVGAKDAALGCVLFLSLLLAPSCRRCVCFICLWEQCRCVWSVWLLIDRSGPCLVDIQLSLRPCRVAHSGWQSPPESTWMVPQCVMAPCACVYTAGETLVDVAVCLCLWVAWR